MYKKMRRHFGWGIKPESKHTPSIMHLYSKGKWFLTLYFPLRDSLTKTHLLWDDDAVFKRFLSPMIHAVPVVPTGKIKSFGPFGPKYQVGPVLRPWGDDDWMVEITVVETGEKTEYRWTHLNDDPEAP
jgi:hypothetical protein